VSRKPDRVPKTSAPRKPPRPKTVTIPRGLAEATVQALLSAPAANVYLLLREWDTRVPGLLVPNRPPEGQAP
jgi:hypothetical protein